VKLRVDDKATLLAQLSKLRAKRLSRVFERNSLFDLANRELMKRDALLRLRWEFAVTRGLCPPAQAARILHSPSENTGGTRKKRRSNAGAQARLAYKGQGNRTGRYKIRRELELAIGDPETLVAVLKELHFKPAFRYEKFRTEFRLPQVAGLAVELDETPIGTFMELEGRPRDIDRAARLLGRTPREYITDSYYTLYADFCHRHGRAIRHMVFHSRKS